MKHKPFRGLGAILFKEFIVVWRDPLTLFFFFFPPLIEMVAFGYALDNDIKHMAMLILNEDRSVESRLLIDRFVNTETFVWWARCTAWMSLRAKCGKAAPTPRWTSRRPSLVTSMRVTPHRYNCLSTDPTLRRRCKPLTPDSVWR